MRLLKGFYHTEQAGFVPDDNEIAAAVGEGTDVQEQGTRSPNPENAVGVFNTQTCMDEAAVAQAVLKAVNWERAEPAQGANGIYMTTRSHNITAKPGDGYRYQIGISVIRREDKGVRADGMTRQQKKAAEALGLTPAEAERILTLKKDKVNAQVAEKLSSLR